MRVHESVMMESESSIADIVARLERVQELLESEGWYVKANSVALAIAALKDPQALCHSIDMCGPYVPYPV
jgi:hypothetical protein